MSKTTKQQAVVITVLNGKGGVGKTTTTKFLAHEARRMGNKVLLIDLDPKQSNLTKGFNVNACSTLDGVNNLALIFQCDSIPDAIVLDSTLHLIPASKKLESVANYCEKGRDLKLRQYVSKISHMYDYIIIDTNPGIEVLHTNTILASDILVMPVQQAKNAAEGMEQFFHDISRTMSEYESNKPKKFFIIPSMHDKRSQVDQFFLEDYRNITAKVKTMPFLSNKEVVVTDFIPQNTLFKKADAAMSWSVQDYIRDYGPASTDLIGRIQLIGKQILENDTSGEL